MPAVTKISRLAAAAAIGISLAACGSSTSSAKTAAASTPAAGSSTSSSTSNAPSASATSSTTASTTPDAVTLVHEARAATKKAKSAHLSGSIVDAGGKMALDIRGTMDGTNQELGMGLGSKGNATIRTVGKAYYIKGDKAFWAANGGPAGSGLLAGKWFRTADAPPGDVTGMTIGALLNEALGPQNIPDSELTSDTTTRKTTYDGQPAYLVTQTSTGDSIIISARTKYVLQLKSGSGTDSSGDLHLSGWDQQPKLTAPAGAIALPAGA